MNQPHTAQEKFNRLRRQAELLLAQTGNRSDVSHDKDPLRLIQELQTFQIELDLQAEELHRSQQELMQAKIRYTELYDYAPVGYATIDLKGVIQNANLTLANKLLTERVYLLNHPLSAHILFDDQDLFYLHLRKLFTSKRGQICELRMEKKDSTPLEVRLESSVILNEAGVPVQYRIIIIDISHQKSAQREKEALEAHLYQSRKMETIGNLIGGIAHDFNNILSVILGNAELSLMGISEENPMHVNLGRIKAASLRAAVIIKQLLTFSHKADRQSHPMDAVRAIHDSFKLLRSIIPRTIEINVDLPAIEMTILADPVQINQILMNLCINAAQAMEVTGGVLTITAATVILDDKSLPGYPGLCTGRHIKIEIKDTGPGIPPEILEQIFEPYFTTKEIGKGTGLGLFVVDGLVKSHNGLILVKSQTGNGSLFSLFLPLIDGPPSAETIEDPLLPGGSESILLVDDEVEIIEMLDQALTELGYRVEAQVDPNKALALFRSKPDVFDLVITDMTMPQITGVQLCNALVDIRPDIPVILCTGHNSLIDKDKAGQMGMAGYLEKPTSLSTLATTIRNILDARGKQISSPSF